MHGLAPRHLPALRVSVELLLGARRYHQTQALQLMVMCNVTRADLKLLKGRQPLQSLIVRLILHCVCTAWSIVLPVTDLWRI
jgi:hypothetical protein